MNGYTLDPDTAERLAVILRAFERGQLRVADAAEAHPEYGPEQAALVHVRLTSEEVEDTLYEAITESWSEETVSWIEGDPCLVRFTYQGELFIAEGQRTLAYHTGADRDGKPILRAIPAHIDPMADYNFVTHEGRAGWVSTGAQRWAGQKTFFDGIICGDPQYKRFDSKITFIGPFETYSGLVSYGKTDNMTDFPDIPYYIEDIENPPAEVFESTGFIDLVREFEGETPYCFRFGAYHTGDPSQAFGSILGITHHAVNTGPGMGYSVSAPDWGVWFTPDEIRFWGGPNGGFSLSAPSPGVLAVPSLTTPTVGGSGGSFSFLGRCTCGSRV